MFSKQNTCAACTIRNEILFYLILRIKKLSSRGDFSRAASLPWVEETRKSRARPNMQPEQYQYMHENPSYRRYVTFRAAPFCHGPESCLGEKWGDERNTAKVIWARADDIRLRGEHARRNQLRKTKALLHAIERRRSESNPSARESRALRALLQRTRVRAGKLRAGRAEIPSLWNRSRTRDGLSYCLERIVPLGHDLREYYRPLSFKKFCVRLKDHMDVLLPSPPRFPCSG